MIARSLRPGRAMGAFVAIMLPVLVLLGFWQLDRAALKRDLETRYLEQLGTLPVAPPAAPAGRDFLRVRLTGRYEAGHSYLVDNRTYRGRAGYWVVSRFRAADGRRFLVNRGWVAAPLARDELPAISDPPGKVTIVGLLWPDTGLPPLLARDSWSKEWPRRVQRLDVQRMAAEDGDLVPVEVRLEAGQPGVFAAASLAVAFRPERHQAYAAQWFGLALVLLAGFLVFARGRAADAGDEDTT